MEKLESKLRNMSYFIMKWKGATVDEKLKILDALEAFRNTIEVIKERKEVKNEMD